MHLCKIQPYVGAINIGSFHTPITAYAHFSFQILFMFFGVIAVKPWRVCHLFFFLPLGYNGVSNPKKKNGRELPTRPAISAIAPKT